MSRWKEGGADDGEEWVAEGRLRLFGLAMSSRSANHRHGHAQGAKEMSHYHRFQTQSFHVVPSIDPIVSVVNLYGQKTHSIKADQSVKLGNGTVNG